MLRALTALAATLAISVPAGAQITVIGGGLAEDCYLGVKTSTRLDRQIDETCTRALEQETMTRKNRAATYVNRGIVRMRMERFERADADFQRAMMLKDDLGDIYVNRGALLFHLGDFQGSVEALDTALELETTEPHVALYNRALSKEELGDVTGAYNDFVVASELKPDWDLPLRQLDRFTVTGG